MRLIIPNKNDFVRAFIAPVSKIDNTPCVKIADGELSCFVDRGADVILFAKYHCDVVDADRSNLILPDANNFIKALQCTNEESITLKVEENRIKYSSAGYRFRYFLFDEAVKRSNDHIFHQIKKLQENNDTSFTITKDNLKQILRLLPLVTESSKMYMFTQDGGVYGDLKDKTLQNTNEFTACVSEKYTGSEIEQDRIIVNLELFRMLNTLNFSALEVFINSDASIVNVKCKLENAELNYVVSSHKQ